MEAEQLRTLAAIVDEESFEGAAHRLRITPSAVSQRIKALEAAVGSVVLQRSSPPTVTPSGEVLLRVARQQEVLHREAWDQLGHEGGRLALSVAVNADSLATWFRRVVAAAASWPDVTLRLRVDDQDHTRDLLRRGAVLGGVTAHPGPVAGCRSSSLGAMRYVPCAAPDLVDRHRRGRSVGWDTMPVVRFNPKDGLQAGYLERRGASGGPVHEVPGSESFVAAILAGLGWGLVPEAQLGDRLRSGQLVRLARDHVDVHLHWQVWTIDSPRVRRLTEAVQAAAHTELS